MVEDAARSRGAAHSADYRPLPDHNAGGKGRRRYSNRAGSSSGRGSHPHGDGNRGFDLLIIWRLSRSRRTICVDICTNRHCVASVIRSWCNALVLRCWLSVTIRSLFVDGVVSSPLLPAWGLCSLHVSSSTLGFA